MASYKDAVEIRALMEICRRDDDIDKDGKDVWGREDSIHKDGSALNSQKNLVSVSGIFVCAKSVCNKGECLF